jgi:hypothetical protein
MCPTITTPWVGIGSNNLPFPSPAQQYLFASEYFTVPAHRRRWIDGLSLKQKMAKETAWRRHSCLPCRDSSRHRLPLLKVIKTNPIPNPSRSRIYCQMNNLCKGSPKKRTQFFYSEPRTGTERQSGPSESRPQWRPFAQSRSLKRSSRRNCTPPWRRWCPTGSKSPASAESSSLGPEARCG